VKQPLSKGNPDTVQDDSQKYFVDHGVRSIYSVWISGYHIAETRANPISQKWSSSPAVYLRHRTETKSIYQIIREYWPWFQAGGRVMV